MNQSTAAEIIKVLTKANKPQLANRFAQAHKVEAAPQSDTIAAYYDNAERMFFEEVAKIVNKKVKSKGKAVVKAGRTVTWIEYDGVDASDFEVSMHLGLILKWPDVKLDGTVNSAYTGKRSVEYSSKVGQLTVKVAADVMLKQIEWGS